MITAADINEHDREYWHYQFTVVSRYLLPLLRRWGITCEGLTVLDVGCGEGGGLAAMHDAGARCAGYDIEPRRIALAGLMQGDRNIAFTLGNLADEHAPFLGTRYDLVVLHDVFEHLEDKTTMLERLRRYMKPEGRLLITFPPYYSAYGAHQQLLSSTVARVPFFHLLPWSLSGILPRLRGEDPATREEIRKLGRLRMGIGKFERICRSAGMRVTNRYAYLIGPNHIRFGLKPVPAGPIAAVPVLKELLCSGVVYLLANP